MDANIIFSALLYPAGNERRLFTVAEEKRLPLIVLDYTLEELKAVFVRKRLSHEIVLDFLGTYRNVAFRAIGEITGAEAEVAKTTVRDLKDRPLFVFVHRQISLGKDCFLITGDKDLHTAEVNRRLCGRVYTAGEFLDKSGRS